MLSIINAIFYLKQNVQYTVW